MAVKSISVWAECDAQGRAIVFALDWPGACGRGEHVDVAIDDLRGSLKWIDRWLRTHGEPGPGHVEAPVEIVQTVTTGAKPLEGDTEAFFDRDAEPFTKDELDDTIEYLDCSRTDLLELVGICSDADLEARHTPDSRSIHEIIDHVAVTEWWYTTRIAPDPKAVKDWQEYGDDGLTRQENIRAMVRREFFPRLRSMPPAERIFRFERSGETWTARKVLRRMIWHELYHLRQVERRLSRRA